MNADKVTTIVGAIGAASMAAQPVLNGVQGSLKTGDWLSLLTAIAIAVVSWFTGKTPKTVAP